ncbi:acyltransferase [Janibacter limosus]|jgi:acetyltransferase-like isoleucine patch superfamily enzyme|uniref:acyltransferase n=1 Tax=Janibacter limosus TaxID=53458 RepID=UPI00082CA5C5|nr:acyltransferase [Janibacter limosus]
MSTEVIRSYDDVAQVRDNVVHLRETEGSTFQSSSIAFFGTGNVLYVEDGAKLKNCTLRFRGNDSVIHIRASSRTTQLKVTTYNESVLYLGPGASFTSPARALPSERTHVIIGSDAMFSHQVTFRTADPHLVYSATTHKRVNPSRSIWVGDHVWLGQEALILKGAHIGSGSILGARSVLTKDVPSNASAAGSPARVVGSDIFWTRPSVHTYTRAQTLKSQKHKGDEFIYGTGPGVLDPETLEAELDAATSGEERAEWCHRLDALTARERFYRDASGPPAGAAASPSTAADPRRGARRRALIRSLGLR